MAGVNLWPVPDTACVSCCLLPRCLLKGCLAQATLFRAGIEPSCKTSPDLVCLGGVE
jgi:hypothetical protein